LYYQPFGAARGNLRALINGIRPCDGIAVQSSIAAAGGGVWT